jgi:hypothetical protein
MKLLIAVANAIENLLGSDMTAPTLSGGNVVAVLSSSSPPVLQNGLLLPVRPPVPSVLRDDDHGYLLRCGACWADMDECPNRLRWFMPLAPDTTGIAGGMLSNDEEAGLWEAEELNR